MKHWKRANVLGDLILPVKVNPDLPKKLLFRRSSNFKGEEWPVDTDKKMKKRWKRANLLGNQILFVRLIPDFPKKLPFRRSSEL